ncbi:hypothetical protein [Sorangium sp. So ce1099]|uniref:hypothetical protein n=1 Tax=Sorangium sp. So ce1099 TaxID=3133331 RepID=UPI003F5E25EE
MAAWRTAGSPGTAVELASARVMLGAVEADDSGRARGGRGGRGFAIPPPYAAGPPSPRAFEGARRLVAVVWLSANAVLLAVAAFAGYLAAVTVLVEGAGFSWRAWLTGAGARAGAALLGAGAVALLLYPLNTVVLRWVYRPEGTRAPRVLALALVAVVALSTLTGALQSLYIHVHVADS